MGYDRLLISVRAPRWRISTASIAVSFLRFPKQFSLWYFHCVGLAYNTIDVPERIKKSIKENRRKKKRNLSKRLEFVGTNWMSVATFGPRL